MNKTRRRATKAAMAKQVKKKAPPAATIAKTQFDDQVGLDLAWHFGSIEADAGLRSSQGPLVDMALSGPPTGGARRSGDAHVTDSWHRKNSKHHRIHTAMAMLSTHHRRVLEQAYTDERFPAEVYSRFPALGRCAGLVLVVQEARLAFARCSTGADELGEWLRGKVPSSTLTTISDASVKLLQEARAAYLVAVGSVRVESAKIRKASIARAPMVRPEPVGLPRRVFAE